MKKVAVVLSGCGYLDGSELTESVSLLVELDRLDAQASFYAPNFNYSPTSHFDSSLLETAKRNSLEESARISRGKIRDLSELKTEKYDGLALPGGFGAAKHLSTWAMDKEGCSINKDIKRAISSFHGESKPILAMCIAPVLVAKTLGKDFAPSLTLGENSEHACDLEKTGADHVDCKVTDFVTDRENKIVSTPAYMCDARPHEVFTGISRATTEFVEMC